MRFSPRSLPTWLSSAQAVLAILVLDQASKALARHCLAGAAPIRLLAGCLRFDLHFNPGVFLGLGRDWPSLARLLLFTVVPTLMAIAIWIGALRWRQRTPGAAWLLVAVAAGTLGNQLDRVFNHGLVTDFALVQIGPVHTGVFNVADLVVTLAALAMVLACRPSPSQCP